MGHTFGLNRVLPLFVVNATTLQSTKPPKQSPTAALLTDNLILTSNFVGEYHSGMQPEIQTFHIRMECLQDQ